jgi:outer membrane protein assembly factor BamB
LYALDQQSGAVLWKKSPAQTTGDPAYASGAAYLQIAAGVNQVLGWDVQTQAQVFSASYSNQFNTYLAPVISDGSLYVGGGYYGGQVYSYATSNGAVNWITTSPYIGSYGAATPAVDASHVYATGGGGSDLLVFDRATGALLSETGPHGEALSGSPVLTGSGGLFYIQNGTGYFLDVTDPTSPHIVWSRPGLSEGDYPAYANGTIYVSPSSALYALDTATGQVKWSLTGIGSYRNLIVTDNALFAAQGSNTVAISLQTHQVLWSVPTVGAMALSDSELFIGADGNVTAYLVPEPSSLLMLAPWIAGVSLRRRRRICSRKQRKERTLTSPAAGLSC